MADMTAPFDVFVAAGARASAQLGCVRVGETTSSDQDFPMMLGYGFDPSFVSSFLCRRSRLKTRSVHMSVILQTSIPLSSFVWRWQDAKGPSPKASDIVRASQPNTAEGATTRKWSSYGQVA